MSSICICLGGFAPAEFPEFPAIENCVAVIAADSGLALADKFELDVDLIVGDMDSVDVSLLDRYEKSGTKVLRYSPEKDETDFELALREAAVYEADQLVIVGGGAGRLDHMLSVIAIAAGPLSEKWIVDLFTLHERISICRPNQPREIVGVAGETVSLIPVGAHASGVRTSGLKWELSDSILNAYQGRGVSNQFNGSRARVSVASGALAIIQRATFPKVG